MLHQLKKLSKAKGSMGPLILKSIILISLMTSFPVLGSPRILIIGDSLTEGYGVSPQEAYPVKLEKIIRSSQLKKATVVNAGTSGATSAFGLRTLKFQAKHKIPDLLILALGANDALRGISTKETQKNLDLTISFAKSKKIKTILVGMLAPPNYGIKFPKEFAAIYEALSKKHNIPLVPFLLTGVAGNPDLNLPDGIHPNEKGYDVVAQHVWNSIKEHLQ